jgi:hypothetical protein
LKKLEKAAEAARPAWPLCPFFLKQAIKLRKDFLTFPGTCDLGHATLVRGALSAPRGK